MSSSCGRASASAVFHEGLDVLPARVAGMGAGCWAWGSQVTGSPPPAAGIFGWGSSPQDWRPGLPSVWGSPLQDWRPGFPSVWGSPPQDWRPALPSVRGSPPQDWRPALHSGWHSPPPVAEIAFCSFTAKGAERTKRDFCHMRLGWGRVGGRCGGKRVYSRAARLARATLRRDVRVAEGARLEIVCAVCSGT